MNGKTINLLDGTELIIQFNIEKKHGTGNIWDGNTGSIIAYIKNDQGRYIWVMQSLFPYDVPCTSKYKTPNEAIDALLNKLRDM